MKIVYFGTPRFAAEVLEYLLKNEIEVVAVITKPDRPIGRSSQPVKTPVKCVVESYKVPLPVFQPPFVSDEATLSLLASFQADLFVVVAYGEILKQSVLDLPKVACINLHASLLPKYRGAAPIQRSIIEGEVETGVTVMHMVRKMDAGDIISFTKVPIDENMTYQTLEKNLCREGSKLLLQAIRDFEKGVSKREPQDHTLATVAPKIELEDTHIQWNSSAKDIHNFVRGVHPSPGAWCYALIKDQKKRLRILSTLKSDLKIEGQLGDVHLTEKGQVIVCCGEGCIELLEVQPEGKKVMSAKAFMCGLSQQLHLI